MQLELVAPARCRSRRRRSRRFTVPSVSMQTWRMAGVNWPPRTSPRVTLLRGTGRTPRTATHPSPPELNDALIALADNRLGAAAEILTAPEQAPQDRGIALLAQAANGER
jgi:hypothetical protein